MYYAQTWPEPQKAPPTYEPLTAGDHIHLSVTPPTQWHYAGDIHYHHQQFSSPNPTDPNSNYYDYQYNSIRSPPKVQELIPHSGGYANHPLTAASYPLDGAAASVDPSYPCTAEGFSTLAVGSAVDGVYSYSGENPRTIAAREAIRQYGAHPMGYASKPWKPPKTRKINKNRSKKTPKVVRSAYCEACKVECNSQGVLKSHNAGKKHKRKLKQRRDSITREAAIAPAAEDTTADDDGKLDANRRRTAAPAALDIGADLETKRSRIVEAGGMLMRLGFALSAMLRRTVGEFMNIIFRDRSMRQWWESFRQLSSAGENASLFSRFAG